METTTNKTVTFKVELSNRIRGGQAVGNLYGVARYINGCRNTWVLEPQMSQEAAHAFCSAATASELVTDDQIKAIAVAQGFAAYNGIAISWQRAAGLYGYIRISGWQPATDCLSFMDLSPPVGA